MQDELDFTLRSDEIPLPAFQSLTIPLLGTPLFHDRVKSRQFLPKTKLRDMDGFTLLTHPLDDMACVIPFVRGLVKLDGPFARFAHRSIKFWWRYHKALSRQQMAFLMANSFPALIDRRRTVGSRDEDQLTYVTSTQPIGPLYSPAFSVDERYVDYFRPTMITDASGELHANIALNLPAGFSHQ
jgi:hypothetical protein